MEWHHTDHPRSRGEYLHAAKKFLDICGSSPLSRGILGGVELSELVAGIIPALAGNTNRNLTKSSNKGDHPRSRGEYLSLMTNFTYWKGSSPLSRGILQTVLWRTACGWIIPALAGNTRPRRFCRRPVTDHPRSRGEYTACLRRSPRGYGSSPLSRGIPLVRVQSKMRDRIIPALAGNTTQAGPDRSPTRDHPRSRGEY